MRNQFVSKSLQAALALAVVALIGCSDRKNVSPFPTISETARANLSAPVNCATAPEDIQTLKDEQASVGKQILAGVRSVLPIAAVAGLLMGDYNDRFQVATGQYNADISAKIAQIEKTCGVK